MTADKILILPVQPGETNVTLTAEDNFGGTAPLDFYVEVRENNPLLCHTFLHADEYRCTVRSFRPYAGDRFTG